MSEPCKSDVKESDLKYEQDLRGCCWFEGSGDYMEKNVDGL